MKVSGKFLLAGILALVLSSCAFSSSSEPYIGDNGNWWVNGSDTGHPATGEPGKDGSTPVIEIGENGNWWIDGVDTGVSATGEPGKDGSDGNPGQDGKPGEDGRPGQDGTTPSIEIGENGNWVINGVDTGVSSRGEDGNGIVSIEKVSSEGNVDTYLIKFSDGGTFSFEVNNGETVTVVSISFLREENGNYVYEVRLSDGTSYPLELPIPEDGLTPYIGDNGNWWIGQTDTGVLADPAKDDRGPISDGIDFAITTINGVAGMVVSDYRGSDVDVVIPNYVGLVPVIGIYREAFERDTDIRSVSLSKNTVYLEEYAFDGCSSLSEFDFNGCHLTEIADYAFRGTVLEKVELPTSVVTIGDYAFDDAPITEINYQNITKFGEYCLNSSSLLYYYLTDDVEAIGSYAFGDNFVYLETEGPKETFDSVSSEDNYFVAYGCRIDDGYIVSDNEDGSLTVYQAPSDVSGNVRIPSVIGGKNVTVIGLGFGSVNPSVDWEDLLTGLHRRYNSVFVPEGVTKVDLYAFYANRVFIHLPSTLQSMGYRYVFGLAFAGDALPAVSGGDYDDEEISILNSLLGIAESDLVYDETSNAFYLDTGLSLKLLYFIGGGEADAKIPSFVGSKPVTTIGKGSFQAWDGLKTVTIAEGIEKIEAYGILAQKAEALLLPSSMADMNADAVICDGSVLTNASSKPDDWDSNWYEGSGKVCFGRHFEAVGSYFVFNYALKDDSTIMLLSLDEADTKSLYIPSEIDGHVVNEIAEDFGTDNAWFNAVYLPLSIETIGDYAFRISSSCRLYYEGDSLKEGWTDGPIYLNSASYLTCGYSLDGLGFDEETGIAYQHGRLLAYYGSSTEVRLPREIGGEEVTAVAEGFVYNSSSSAPGYSVYVPETIVTLEYHSFYLYQATSKVYLEAASKLEGYDGSFAYLYNSSQNLIYGYELDY